MQMEFIEAQHLAIAEQGIERCAQGIVQLSVQVHALVQASEKVMKVQAALGLHWQRLKETIEQPALAAAHRAMEVKAARLACVQVRQLRSHALYHPALAVAELVATAACFIFEPVEQFTGFGCSTAQALTKLAQRGGDPGGHA